MMDEMQFKDNEKIYVIDAVASKEIKEMHKQVVDIQRRNETIIKVFLLLWVVSIIAGIYLFIRLDQINIFSYIRQGCLI